MCKFFVVGDATVDQMYFVSELPEPGGEINADKALMQPGGAGGTIATVLARLGNDVKIATRVGKGPFSELALMKLKSAGVDLSLIQVDEGRQTSNVTLLITPDTQRTMISAVGASRFLDSAYLKPEQVTGCDALIVSAYSLQGGQQREYTVRALELARQANMTTFVDLGTGVVNDLRDRLIYLVQDVDYLLMNEKELYRRTGASSRSDAVAHLRGHGVERVVVKVGAMGSIVITPELNELVEAYDVDSVVDSTGAGDYYTAAFAHSVMRGDDLIYAARLGNVAGGLNTTVVGAQSYEFGASELDEHAEEYDAVHN